MMIERVKIRWLNILIEWVCLELIKDYCDKEWKNENKDISDILYLFSPLSPFYDDLNTALIIHIMPLIEP